MVFFNEGKKGAKHSIMHSINSETCKKCGLCAEMCPNGIIDQAESGEVKFRPERLSLCVRCGHCMAVCPTKSIISGGLSYEEEFFDLPKRDTGDDYFSNLIASRRSIRNFQDKPIPGEILQKVVDAISMAPMGFPPHKVEVTIIQNREMIEKALPPMLKLYEDFLKWMRNPLARFFMKRMMKLETFNTIQNHLAPSMEKGLPEMKEKGRDIFTRGAPALILFHAPRGSENHTEDIYIDLTYGFLAAHSLGLGATAIGLIPPAVERNKDLRKLFQIPKDNEVLASMIVGYPKVSFKRGIKRKLAKVTWI